MAKRRRIDDVQVPGDELSWVAFYPWFGVDPGADGLPPEAIIEEPAADVDPA